ncbi:MAG: acyl-CoA thioesterase [Planctomycetaceae bacterium]|nr:acyl-CoA thioesterase [Planctomycetaceae bacterium]
MSSITTHTMPIRVRYSETDAMGFLHHGNYPAYFEEARTELFRVNGGDYRAMEEAGLFFVVVSMTFRFRSPARYDDVLNVTVELERYSAAKLEHNYTVRRGETLIAEGKTVLALVDGNGQVQRITEKVPGIPAE